MANSKFNDVAKIILGIMILILTGAYGAYIYFAYIHQPDLKEVLIAEAESDIPQCFNLTMKETAYCLNRFATKNFYYNYTNDLEVRDIETFKEFGGDCKDYTEFYERYLKDYAFKTEQVTIDMKTVGLTRYQHVFLVVSDETGYCLLDVQNIECTSYKNKPWEALKNETN